VGRVSATDASKKYEEKKERKSGKRTDVRQSCCLRPGDFIASGGDGESDVDDEEGAPRPHKVSATLEATDEEETEKRSDDDDTRQAAVDAGLLGGTGDADVGENLRVVGACRGKVRKRTKAAWERWNSSVPMMAVPLRFWQMTVTR
jgi:hypothetical protein